MTSEQVYKEAINLIEYHIYINEESMDAMQDIGSQSLKRMHRFNAKNMFDAKICLKNNYRDRYRKVLKVTQPKATYTPMTIKEHLEKYDLILAEDITTFARLQVAMFNLTGQPSSDIDDILSGLKKLYEKTGRWIANFNKVGWDEQSLQIFDFNFHEKMKKIED